jgi:hypothetical protein
MANGQNNNGEGINFGRNVVDRDITSPLVLTAIDSCLAEGW